MPCLSIGNEGHVAQLHAHSSALLVFLALLQVNGDHETDQTKCRSDLCRAIDLRSPLEYSFLW